jgi:hypothetical protein
MCIDNQAMKDIQIPRFSFFLIKKEQKIKPVPKLAGIFEPIGPEFA